MKRIPIRQSAIRQRQHGAALVEFALILPLLVLLTFTVTELGRALWHYKVLNQSAREAARYLSTKTPGTGVEQARNLVLYGSLNATGSYQLSDLRSSQVVRVQWSRQAGLALVSVTVSGYAFESLAGSVWGQKFGRIPFGDISASWRAVSCGTVC